MNQPAYDAIFAKYSVFDFKETAIAVKHEGETLAYAVEPNGKHYSPEAPAWLASKKEGDG